MKILELRFNNLNSLYGQWLIDFRSPEFSSDGIFAITGSTGAGKSTVLDAICLALYGRTPRLNAINKSGNEIMSRQTGECFAEVTFAAKDGNFRCHWSQHRSRKKADGELQSPKHEIVDADTGQVLDVKLRQVAKRVEATTGMDFERFTRSILLAQGGFDTFLKADIEQKSKILEQITGTEIYTKISKRVHERKRDEQGKLDLLQAETAGIVILEPEQEKELAQKLESKQKQEVQLGAKASETGKAITWLTGIADLEKEIVVLSEEAGKVTTETDEFKPLRERLNQAEKAAALDGNYATLTTLRKQQSDDQAILITEKKKLPELETSVGKQEKSLQVTEKQTLAAKKDLQDAAPLIQKVRSLDQKLASQKEAISKAEKSCKADAEKIGADQELLQKEQKKRRKAEKNLKRAGEYLIEHAQDEWLISGLAGVEEQLATLLTKQKEITRQEAGEENSQKALKQAVKKLATYQEQSKARQEELKEARKALQQSKQSLNKLLGDRLLREYRTEKETLLREMAYLTKIAELEDHRAKLEDDKPCPLCGAKEHPFAEGNVPVADETEKKIATLGILIDKAEKQEAVIEKFAEDESKVVQAMAEDEKLENAAGHEKKAAEKSLSDLQDGLKKIYSEFAELKDAVAVKLQPLGIETIHDADIPALLASLEKRLKKWQAKIKKKAEIDKEVIDLDSEMKTLAAVIENQGDTLAKEQRILESLKKEYSQWGSERQEVYGDKITDDEELRLQKAITDAEKAEKQTKKLHDELRQKLNTTTSNVLSLEKRTSRQGAELRKQESAFTAVLELAGFSDEKDFLAACLPGEEREELSAKAKKLDDRQTALKARQKDHKKRLTTEIGKKITDKTLLELEPQAKEYDDTLKQLRDSSAGLKLNLSDNIAAKERIKEKQAAIDAQKKECSRWENLHSLIGSADGKRYRNFAQGLTFELMASHANRQLEKMTDRYLLIRDSKQPLDLNVVDNYQAGEIRSTKNLSGGESFIVSLSLALGLSKMASQKVRVDSLFLDEGFGTLDEDALETALETLGGLQQDGKLIGVISHVPALKERIGTQINISPLSGGKSVIIGPGCKQVTAI